MGILALSAAMLLGACTNNNENTTSSVGTSKDTTSLNSQVNDITLKSATLSSDSSTPGKLIVKASKKEGETGTIYYAITKLENKECTNAEIMNPDSAVFVKSGHSDEDVDTSFDLEAGVTYYGYFLLKRGDNYSNIVKRNATTYINSSDMGDGSEETPFKISTLEDLEAIGGTYAKYDLEFKTTSHYILMDDIDLSSKYNATSQTSWTPIESFDGVFDGNGHKISNLYINSPETTGRLGLFSQVNTKGIVKNLTIEDVTITAKGASENARGVDSNGNPTTSDVKNLAYYTPNTDISIGVLTGDVKGQVDNVHIKKANITVDGSRVGGLTGRFYSDEGTSAKISNSSVEETTIQATNRVGGIAGLVDSKSKVTHTQALIENCTFQGTIQSANKELKDPDTSKNPNQSVTAIVAAEYIGGIAGYYRGCDMKNVVSEANITGYRHIGGVIGFQQFNGKTNVGEHYSTLDGAMANVELHVGENIKNMGPIVGNKSTSYTSSGSGDKLDASVTMDTAVSTNNAYFVSTSKFYSGTGEIGFDALPSSAKYGTSVEASALTSEWYNTYLVSFDFDKVFQLDDTTKLPVLK